jgi:flagellar motility protein MotE (MotC chaperone)
MAVIKLRIRPLTVGIVIAILVLGLRVGDLWRSVGTAQAQQPPAPAAQAPAPVAPAVPAAAAPATKTTDDVTSLTGAEIEVLQQLAARRSDIEKRASELDRREAVLKGAEERIDAKIREIKKLQATVEQAISRYDEQEAKRLESLVKIYETMKPNDAAKIFEQMDLPTLVSLVERMSTRKVAPVLALMNAVRAKQVTTELSKRRVPGAPADEASGPAASAGG